MWASWAKLFAEILEFESDFRHDLELLYMVMIVKGRQGLGFVRCVFCVCLNVLNRITHTAKEKPAACTCPVLDSI